MCIVLHFHSIEESARPASRLCVAYTFSFSIFSILFSRYCLLLLGIVLTSLCIEVLYSGYAFELSATEGIILQAEVASSVFIKFRVTGAKCAIQACSFILYIFS